MQAESNARVGAAALVSAGAHGVVLDGALLLARESPLPAEVQARLEAGVAEESLFLGQVAGERYRVILHSPELIKRFAPDVSTSFADYRETSSEPPAAAAATAQPWTTRRPATANGNPRKQRAGF